MAYPLNVVSLPITELYGTPIRSKMRAAVVTQAQCATLQFQLFDYSGPNVCPVDLTAYGYSDAASAPQGPQCPGGIFPGGQGPQCFPVPWLKARFKEAVGLGGCAKDAASMSIIDAVNGVVGIDMPPQIYGNSGIYICECGVFNASNCMTFSNTAYVMVERGLFSTSNTTEVGGSGGAPTLQEIRVNLRDQPEINRLIDEYEFDLADICDAIVRAVMYFNQSQPPIPWVFTTNNFPWRFYWLDGIASYLYETAASFYRRNRLKHQTAGLAVDDLDREREYTQAYQMRLDRWQKWTVQKRVELNMQMGFSTFGSPYANDYDGWATGGGTW